MNSEHAVIGQQTLVLKLQKHSLCKTEKDKLPKQVYGDLIIKIFPQASNSNCPFDDLRFVFLV